MLAGLEALAGELVFEFEVVDVDADPELERRFNDLVPVLMHADKELARWRLDVGALRANLLDIG